MEVMVYLLAGCGVMVVFLATALFCVAGWERFRAWMLEHHQPSYLAGCEAAKNALRGDAWWFSESPATQSLLRDLASGVSVSEARERWRKNRIAEERAIEIDG